MAEIALGVALYIGIVGLLAVVFIEMIRQGAKRRIPKLPEAEFLVLASFNDEYATLRSTRSLSHQMFRWFLAYGVKKHLESDGKDEDSKVVHLEPRMLKLPVQFIRWTFRQWKETQTLHEIAPVTACVAALSKGVGKRIRSAGLDIPPGLLEHQGKDWQELAWAYVERFKFAADTRDGDEVVNLSQLDALARLCDTVGLKRRLTDRSSGELDSMLEYIEACRRPYGKAVGFAINHRRDLPCTCGTCFGDRFYRLLVSPYASAFDGSEQRQVVKLLNTTFHTSWMRCHSPRIMSGIFPQKTGCFCAYPRTEVPTLVHADLALKMHNDIIHIFLGKDGSSRKRRRPGELLCFLRNCLAPDESGFGLYPNRPRDIHATKCGLTILDKLKKMFPDLSTDSASIKLDRGVKFANEVLLETVPMEP